MTQEYLQSVKYAEQFATIVNNYGFNPNAVAREFSRKAHPTLQQTMMRFVRAYLKEMADDDRYYDDRNRGSHEYAKALLEGHNPEDLPGLPFI